MQGAEGVVLPGSEGAVEEGVVGRRPGSLRCWRAMRALSRKVPSRKVPLGVVHQDDGFVGLRGRRRVANPPLRMPRDPGGDRRRKTAWWRSCGKGALGDRAGGIGGDLFEMRSVYFFSRGCRDCRG